MVSLPVSAPVVQGWIEINGTRYRHCQNRITYDNCNWLIRHPDEDAYCASCRLNRTIPNLSSPANLENWARLEAAKRRLVFSLLHWMLPVQSKVRGWPFGLAFDFIEDRRGNPLVLEDHVATGHERGVITINVAEADDVLRTMARKQVYEAYRTLLGHFRHESGHYYFSFLIENADNLTEFRKFFGDEQQDYDWALKTYYRNGPMEDWHTRYISAYASSHPAEDWAETWAHYLHMEDCLETAKASGLLYRGERAGDFDKQLQEWMQLTVVHNELNRSMGLRDAYPFVINATVADKLRFIYRLLAPRRAAN